MAPDDIPGIALVFVALVLCEVFVKTRATTLDAILLAHTQGTHMQKDWLNECTEQVKYFR